MVYDTDWVSNRSCLSPNKRAIIDAESHESWTYYQLNERAELLANHFLSIGINKGDRIALLATNHVAYFDYLFSCMKIGAVFVPLNWRLSPNELSYVINDSSPQLIGVQTNFFDLAHQLTNVETVMEIASNNYVQDLPSNNRTIDSLMSIPERDPLAMIYTGGTTGRPKGAVLSHRSIMWNAINTIISWNLTDNDTTLTCLPMFHTGGLNALSIPILMAGGTVVLASSFEPEQAIDYLLDFKCTIVLFVPTMYHLLIKTERFKHESFPDMKVFLSGGAPCPLGIYQAFNQRGFAFKEGYGLTEAGPNNFFIDPMEAIKKPGSVGKPMLYNEVRIIDEEGNHQANDQVGELVLRGNHLFEYYWNQPDATSAAFKDEWFYTGDLAKVDEDGYYYIVGRKKDMIISGGENIYPLEVENWIESHEAVDEVAVIGVDDDMWGEMVVAFVTTYRQGEVTEENLREYCKLKLAKYKVPKQFYMVDTLPKTHVGKINKNELKKQIETIKKD